jgi:cytochrome P450
VLTYTMYTLLDYPEIYARCAEDHEYCRNVIEEALRWYNPSTVARFVDSEFEYRGVTFPKDTMLFFPLSISGHDPSAFPDGERFDPERAIDPQRRQIAFALGKHMCLGQYVAQRMRTPRLAGKPGWRPFPGSWGLRGLPIEFTPGKAPEHVNVREPEPA